jgi:hypothetical protein
MADQTPQTPPTTENTSVQEDAKVEVKKIVIKTAIRAGQGKNRFGPSMPT